MAAVGDASHAAGLRPVIRCRACNAGQPTPVVDLGLHPAGAHFPAPGDASAPLLPLRLGMCEACGLAQLADASPSEADEGDAPSPLSSATMRRHAERFAASLAERALVRPGARVVSLASHGGHIGEFLDDGTRVVTLVEQSNERRARLDASGQAVVGGTIDGPRLPAGLEPGSVDLVVDSYLLAHLDHPRAALRRIAELLAPDGALVLEFDWLLATVEGGQWDAIRHGHQAYLTVSWLVRELDAAGLAVTDADTQPVYGGAVRITARRRRAAGAPSPSVASLLGREARAMVDRPAGLAPVAHAVARARRDIPAHLRQARAAEKPVLGYGAPARAVTFLNTLSIDVDLLPLTVDRATAKQGRLIPGTAIPIAAPDALAAMRPDEVLILAWDLAPEIRRSLTAPELANTRFLVAMPTLSEVGPAGEVVASAPDRTT